MKFPIIPQRNEANFTGGLISLVVNYFFHFQIKLKSKKMATKMYLDNEIDWNKFSTMYYRI